MIFVMQIEKLLKNSCIGYLAGVINASKEQNVKPEDVPIFRDFLEVFPEDLPRLLLDREFEFVIELVPGTISKSKASYRMAPTKLKELKKQLQELLDKKFI